MAASDREIVLITGANTGLGFEIAKKLLCDHDDRFYVLIGARTPSKGDAAVEDLHKRGLSACEFVHIDTTDDDSIAKAAQTIEEKYGRLDVLHANAGIAPDKDMLGRTSLSHLIKTACDTNVAGSAQTAETFIPLLQKSPHPRIIFMSTELGSLDRCHSFSNENWPAYSASKAALNMVMLYFYHRFPGMRINASNPGFRATALNNFGQGAPPGLEPKPGSTEYGANNAVRLTLLGRDGETGTLTEMDDATGEVRTVPW